MEYCGMWIDTNKYTEGVSVFQLLIAMILNILLLLYAGVIYFFLSFICDEPSSIEDSV